MQVTVDPPLIQSEKITEVKKAVKKRLHHIFGVLHNSNSLVRLFSLISLMVKYPCLCTQDVHINAVFQWIQICSPYACIQRFTLNDHMKHTSLVLLNSVIYVNILSIVTPM